MQWIRSHLKIILPIAAVVVAAVAYLAFGVFGVQFLFIDDKVDEAAPVFDSGEAADPVAIASGSSEPATTTPPCKNSCWLSRAMSRAVRLSPMRWQSIRCILMTFL